MLGKIILSPMGALDKKKKRALYSIFKTIHALVKLTMKYRYGDMESPHLKL